jgi:hypothetical protein
MYRILTHTALTATLATFAFAQAPQTTDQQPVPRQTETSSTVPASGGQTFKGVLMDASCQAIQDRSATTLSSASRSRTAVDAATSNMPRSTASAAEAGKAATSATTTATTGVATDQSGQATATNRTTTVGRETEKSGSSVKIYDGKTSRSSAAAERSRSAHTNPDVQWTTVREKYKDCKVSPTTTSFAIMSNGQLYMLDGASDALKQRTSSNTPSDWHTVTVVGNMMSDRITVTSVR